MGYVFGFNLSKLILTKLLNSFRYAEVRDTTDRVGEVHFTFTPGDDSNNRPDPSIKLEFEEGPMNLGNQEFGSEIAVFYITADTDAIAFEKSGRTLL